MGGSKWPFTQLAIVVFGFQLAAIGLLICTGTWSGEPPAALAKLNPLWSAFGRANNLVPVDLFSTVSRGHLWRDGANMALWSALQWLGAALLFDLLRQRSR